jgi:hypothetical protein
VSSKPKVNITKIHVAIEVCDLFGNGDCLTATTDAVLSPDVLDRVTLHPKELPRVAAEMAKAVLGGIDTRYTLP